MFFYTNDLFTYDFFKYELLISFSPLKKINKYTGLSYFHILSEISRGGGCMCRFLLYSIKCKQTTKTVKARTKILNKRYKAKHADCERDYGTNSNTHLHL